jgi:hypothetical protein
MFGILGFKENITDPRNLSNISYNYSSNVVYMENKNPYDLGEISVFISAVLLSLGGCVAIVASNIRRSRCVSIDCGISKCSRKIAVDDDIGV